MAYNPIYIILFFICLVGCFGCTTNFDTPYGGVNTKEADYPVKWERFYYQNDMELQCYHLDGWFTKDHKACFIERGVNCYYLTLPYDDKHTIELNAMCNGWRDHPIIRLW